ncbi:16S rRNA methyltransferase, partial [Xanthomonas citri pv. citri]|nr:16S rRNA methyltransferase [Xanthomonas citri pv. citri]
IIAESAAKQSGRGIVPEITEPVTFAQAIEMAKTLDMNIIPYEEAEGLAKSRQIIADVTAPSSARRSLGVFIGPEGGFAREEVEQAMA